MKKFTEEEREELARWAHIFMSSQLEVLNKIIEKEAFDSDNIIEILSRYLDVEKEKVKELVEASKEFTPSKLGVLFMLMALDDRTYEDVHLSVLYSDAK